MPSGIPGSGGECGTYRGWNKHRRHNTEVCDACRQAAKEYQAKWRIEHPEAAANADRTKRVTSRAHGAAMTVLRRRHLDEFKVLYRAALAEQWKKDQ